MLCITGINLRHRTVSASKQHCAPGTRRNIHPLVTNTHTHTHTIHLQLHLKHLFCICWLQVADTSKNEGAVINIDGMEDVPGVGEDNDMPLPNITRDRPFSASMVSRQTVASTRSHASRSPSLITTEYSAKNLFCYRVCLIVYKSRDCWDLYFCQC